jgi:hypothetical protein
VPRSKTFRFGAAASAAAVGLILAITSATAHSAPTANSRSLVGGIVAAAVNASMPFGQQDPAFNAPAIEQAQDAIEAAEKAAALAAEQQKEAAELAAKLAAQQAAASCLTTDKTADASERSADQTEDAGEKTSSSTGDQAEDTAERAADQKEDAAEPKCFVTKHAGDAHPVLTAEHTSWKGWNH